MYMCVMICMYVCVCNRKVDKGNLKCFYVSNPLSHHPHPHPHSAAITDETLLFVNRSRRQIVVVSPEWEVQGTQAMLELRAGLDRMMCGTGLRVILVQYRPIRRHGWVQELRRVRGVLALVRWEGERSQELSSRFWKRLQVELPLRRSKESQSLSVETVKTEGMSLKSIEALRLSEDTSCLTS